MERATGLTNKGVGKALRIVRKVRPDLIPAAEGYQKMLEEGEGTRVPELNHSFREIKGLRQRRPELFEAADLSQAVKVQFSKQ